MTIRKEIESAIKASNGDTPLAAIKICKLMNDKLDLEGNGWFNDDLPMLDELGSDDEDNKGE